MAEIDQWFEKDSIMNQFYRVLAEYLMEHSNVTTEQAVLDTIVQTGLSIPQGQLRTIFRCAEPIDWMVRMYQRERVISVLAEAGFDIWLLGRGWENHPSAGCVNVHRIADRVPFAETLSYMADARLNLNVMPWFKAGTHDRIFNILLQHSLPLTDSSTWIDAHFKDGEDIALFDLDHLELLPGKAEALLANSEQVEQMISRGFKKVKDNFVWKNCVDAIMQEVLR